MKTPRRSFEELQSRAREIRKLYAAEARAAGRPKWGAADFLQGFVGDVGALAKLVMQKKDRRGDGPRGRELDAKLAHELADCLWSVIVLADELGVELEGAFLATMEELRGRLGPKPRLRTPHVSRSRRKKSANGKGREN